jgi:diguanylate cyclase (GGDEF)-like protein
MDILLVEDSASLRATMSHIIAEDGHHCIEAESGEKALEILKGQMVDMILMDVEMPGIDGFETTRHVRELLDEHWIPIIFLTGKSSDQDYLQGIEAGGDDYIIKPVSAVILKAKISAMGRIVEMQNQLKQLNQELEALSQTDGLTQLYNHRTFIHLAQKQWRQATRNNHPVALIMLDIDHFKLYNDHYGHPAGDECLKQVSQALQNVVKRPGDLIARYGGEEFIIFLQDTDVSGAKQIGEQIRQAIEGLQIPHEKSPTNSVVTASIGVSTCLHTTARRLNDMIKHADVLLYNSKNHGRNSVSVDQYLPAKTILLADDDPFIVKVISSQLGSQCQVITATNGRECVDQAKESKPDLILLDIIMPEMDGFEACRLLKADKETAHIPVILISKLSDDDQLKKVKRSGANAYLEKPIEELRLLSKINHFLA